MAVSVSKISVIVDGDTTRLSTASTQAVKSIKQMEAAQQQANAATGAGADSATRAQFAITQLIFAVDDATTSFGTGGYAGAIRAASNNLTAFAALSGNVYALIGTVAITSIAQLTAKYWEKNAALEKTIDLLGKLNEAQQRNQALVARSQESRATARETDQLRRRGVLDVNEWQKELGRVGTDMQKVNDEIQQAEGALRESSKAAEAFRKGTQAIKVDDKDYVRQRDAVFATEQADKERLAHLRGQRFELQLQERLLKNMEKAVANQAFASVLFGAAIGAQVGTGELGGLAAKAAIKRHDIDWSAFSRLPGANNAGSVGAVSTINMAAAGSRNLADSQQAMLDTAKKTETNTRRTAEHLGKMLGNKLTQVGI